MWIWQGSLASCESLLWVLQSSSGCVGVSALPSSPVALPLVLCRTREHWGPEAGLLRQGQVPAFASAEEEEEVGRMGRPSSGEVRAQRSSAAGCPTAPWGGGVQRGRPPPGGLAGPRGWRGEGGRRQEGHGWAAPGKASQRYRSRWRQAAVSRVRSQPPNVKARRGSASGIKPKTATQVCGPGRPCVSGFSTVRGLRSSFFWSLARGR